MTAGAESQTARIRRIGQVALGLIWLIDGALQFQPVMFGKAFVTGVILPNASGQPDAVSSAILWIGHQIEPHVALFNAVAASLQVLIGLGLMSKRTVRPALAVSFVWALAIWGVAEGFGGLLAGTANPLTGSPGAALLYVVVGIMVWPITGDRVRDGRDVLAGRVTWAALWAASAALWLLPANDTASSVHDAISSAPSGAGWLTDLLHAAANAASGQGTLIALVMAGLSTAIAVSILTGAARRTFIRLGIILSLTFWVIGQGMGGVLAGGATDVSTGPLVVLMGCILLAHQRPAGSIQRQSVEARQPAITSA